MRKEVYVYKSIQNLSETQIMRKNKRIKSYMETNGYEKSGGITISRPMCRANEHYSDMLDYCKKRGISTIVVDSSYDISSNSVSLRVMLNDLCEHGMTVELASSGIVYAPKKAIEHEAVEELRAADIVGKVSYANGDHFSFTDADEYIRVIQEELDDKSTTGFQFETITHDPAVRKAVDDAVYDLYGEENPHDLEHYIAKYAQPDGPAMMQEMTM